MALELHEYCGLRHDAQVLVVEGLPEYTGTFALKAEDGRLFPAQRSQQNPELFFVHVALEPFEHLWLKPGKAAGELKEGKVSVEIQAGNVAVIGNEKFALGVALGTDNA